MLEPKKTRGNEEMLADTTHMVGDGKEGGQKSILFSGEKGEIAAHNFPSQQPAYEQQGQKQYNNIRSEGREQGTEPNKPFTVNQSTTEMPKGGVDMPKGGVSMPKGGVVMPEGGAEEWKACSWKSH